MLDVDGVVVRGPPAFARLEADLGLAPALLQAAFFDVYWPQIVIGRDALAPRLAAVLADIAPGLAAETLIAYWFENDAELDAALLAAVADLRRRGHRVLLATNQEHRRARYLMDDLGLGAQVDGIVYSAALGCRKPMPEFYRRATAAAGVPPDRIVLVDDLAANVDAARAAGWQAHLWTAAERLETLLGW